MNIGQAEILQALQRTGELLNWVRPVEILLVGGAAGMITGQLAPGRVTIDCDVMDISPTAAHEAVQVAAHRVAEEMHLPTGWLSTQVQQLDILPDGWRNRRQHVADSGCLRVFATGRLDLLATKCFANRAHDREDLHAMKPTAQELNFVRAYLNMLRVPARSADLDQVQAALRLVDALQEGSPDA